MSGTGRRTRIAARSPHCAEHRLFAALRNLVFVLFEAGEDSSSAGWNSRAELLNVARARREGPTVGATHSARTKFVAEADSRREL